MEFVLGVLGGMGTYATIHLFNQYAEIFPAEKEWDRPRIIIDNRCTMPSRVRAFLYNENKEKLLEEMTDSMKNLMNIGCNRIILACNTSHLFLDSIYEKIPKLKSQVVNIIVECTKKIHRDGIKSVYLLASEGTICSEVYQNELKKLDITCESPSEDEYYKLRECIEAVKQNKYSDSIKNTFIELVNRKNNCILGCTELPILYERYKKEINCNYIYDPLKIALNHIHEEFIRSKEL